MLAKFIDRIVELGAKVEEFTYGGIEYTSKALHKIERQKASAFVVHTLTGLKDYLVANKDALDPGNIIVRVVSPLEVAVMSALDLSYRDREYFIKAECEASKFHFGNFYDLESFNIALQSMFVQTDVSRALLMQVGSISNDSSVNHADDGVSQQITVKAGVRLVKNTIAMNPVLLRPYRTFREVEQPESNFVFRLRKGGDSAPSCGLFEADGGAWENAAILSIAAWLKANLPENIVVIA